MGFFFLVNFYQFRLYKAFQMYFRGNSGTFWGTGGLLRVARFLLECIIASGQAPARHECAASSLAKCNRNNSRQIHLFTITISLGQHQVNNYLCINA